MFPLVQRGIWRIINKPVVRHWQNSPRNCTPEPSEVAWCMRERSWGLNLSTVVERPMRQKADCTGSKIRSSPSLNWHCMPIVWRRLRKGGARHQSRLLDWVGIYWQVITGIKEISSRLVSWSMAEAWTKLSQTRARKIRWTGLQALIRQHKGEKASGKTTCWWNSLRPLNTLNRIREKRQLGDHRDKKRATSWLLVWPQSLSLWRPSRERY